MDLDPGQLRALASVVATGSLEAAARELHVTPSAVSQRLRALEAATGRVLLVRSQPARATAPGEVLLRAARQLALVTDEAARALREEGGGLGDGDGDGGGGGAGAPRPLAPVVPLAVNADSLATWVLPALAPLADRVRLDLRRGDEGRTAELLRDGTVMAAITDRAAPVAGCTSVPLGAVRYRPVAAPAFAARHLPAGPVPSALAVAPVVVLDRDDDLQDRWLRRRGARPGPGGPPRHHVPASADLAAAILLGLGWGMLPDAQCGAALADGRLVLLERGPRAAVDVALHLQRWRLPSPALDAVADALVTAARTALRQGVPATARAAGGVTGAARSPSTLAP